MPPRFHTPLGSRFSLRSFLLAVLLGPAAASAQGPFTLTALRQNDLEFGNLVAGLPRQIVAGSPHAGKYEVFGRPLMRVRLTFNLPAELGAGATRVPVQFGAASGAW